MSTAKSVRSVPPKLYCPDDNPVCTSRHICYETATLCRYSDPAVHRFLSSRAVQIDIQHKHQYERHKPVESEPGRRAPVELARIRHLILHQARPQVLDLPGVTEPL